MDFMKEAVKEAKKGLKKKEGGPFGAVIVCNGKIISKAHNTVLKNDPTAHAEINAIRKASKKLKTFDLSGCDLYTTCYPCPMCYSAIHWARIKQVFYSATSNKATKVGFDDKKLYEILKGKRKSGFKLIKVNSKQGNEVLEDYKGKLY
jgi:guanine deaminase